jgi:hypothetical protein
MAAAEEAPLKQWQVDPTAVDKLTGEGKKKYNTAVKALADSIVQLGGELKCPVCLSLMDEPTQCPCGHCFCRACIGAALRVKKACPLCKQPCDRRKLVVSFVYQGIIKTYRAIQPQGLDTGTQVRSAAFEAHLRHVTRTSAAPAHSLRSPPPTPK